MERGIPARLSAAEGRKFGLQVGIAFLVLAAVMVWREHEIPTYLFGTVGTLLVLAGLAIPGHLGPVYRGWMAFGLALSKVTTPIIMGILFYGIIGPMGVIRRKFGLSPVIREKGSGSYWIDRPDGPTRKSDLQHQF